jgi:hypothetical protein
LAQASLSCKFVAGDRIRDRSSVANGGGVELSK